MIRLDLSTPRVFAAGYRADLTAHRAAFGDFPAIDPQALLAEVQASGLDGRGGAGFSAYAKLASTETNRETVVIANAAEGEYLSFKDRALLEHAPHLVIDGLLIAARLVGSSRPVLYARAESLAQMGLLAQERGVQTIQAPGTYISGEASAAARTYLSGDSRPMDRTGRLNQSEPGTSRWGFGRGGRGPILVHNVETLAQLALIARYGAACFAAEGTRLFTVHPRAVAGAGSPMVLELPHGMTTGSILTRAGYTSAGLTDVPAVLTGGFSGTWITPDELDRPIGATSSSVAADARGGVTAVAAGTGIIYPLLPGENPLTVAGDFLSYLAAENAGQCGPCANGLPALVEAYTAASWGAPGAAAEVARLGAGVTGRGMCSHPDATARFAAHTLATFPVRSGAHRTLQTI